MGDTMKPAERMVRIEVAITVRDEWQTPLAASSAEESFMLLDDNLISDLESFIGAVARQANLGAMRAVLRSKLRQAQPYRTPQAQDEAEVLDT